MSRTVRKVPNWVSNRHCNKHLDKPCAVSSHGSPRKFDTDRDMFIFEYTHGLSKPMNLFAGDGVLVGRKGAKAVKKAYSKKARRQSMAVLEAELLMAMEPIDPIFDPEDDYFPSYDDDLDLDPFDEHYAANDDWDYVDDGMDFCDPWYDDYHSHYYPMAAE